jgi:hypothetical protein
MTLTDVLTFCATASTIERTAILNALNTYNPSLPLSTSTRQAAAAVTLSAIMAGDPVKFTYDSVQYEALVIKINRTTATVKITKIVGTPRRSLFVGSTVRVGASLLAKAMVAGVDGWHYADSEK